MEKGVPDYSLRVRLQTANSHVSQYSVGFGEHQDERIPQRKRPVRCSASTIVDRSQKSYSQCPATISTPLEFRQQNGWRDGHKTEDLDSRA